MSINLHFLLVTDVIFVWRSESKSIRQKRLPTLNNWMWTCGKRETNKQETKPQFAEPGLVISIQRSVVTRFLVYRKYFITLLNVSAGVISAEPSCLLRLALRVTQGCYQDDDSWHVRPQGTYRRTTTSGTSGLRGVIAFRLTLVQKTASSPARSIPKGSTPRSI